MCPVRLRLSHGYMIAAYKEDVMLIRSFLAKATPDGEIQRYDESFFIIPGFLSSKRTGR